MCGQLVRFGVLIVTVISFAFVGVRTESRDSVEQLFDAIRNADAAAVNAALTAGANPNGRDQSRATPLMRAVVYAPVAYLSRLVDSGADVDATDDDGATALMWAGAQTTKIRVLLDRGANPNLKMKDGATALVAAARFGNTEGMRVLMARGADPNASAGGALDLLAVAYGHNNPAMVRVLADAGVRLSNPNALRAGALAPNIGNAETIQSLLSAGANPREELRLVSITVPVVSLAAFNRKNEVVRLLLNRGADPNARASHGETPLIFAAASDFPGSEDVRVLLGRGADARLQDERGRTALDWALARGDKKVAGILRAAGATATAPAAPPTPVASPRPAAHAIESALARLQPVGPIFHQHTRCISCHHQSLPAVAVKLAAERGLMINKDLARHPTEATLAVWRRQEKGMLAGRVSNVQAFMAGATYGLFALAEEGAPPTSTTDAVATRLAAFQSDDGRWDGGSRDLRPPLDGSSITRTALAIRGLSVYAPRGREDMNMHVARGLSFLRSAAPADTQDEAFKLLGLVWGRAAAGDIAKQRRRVLALQRSDGGWGQLPPMLSDAFATGQALYAIQAAGLGPNTLSYQNGVRYLLRTQLDDGTWFVRSRAIGFQPYFDSGFPHGRDQFISAAATSWAAIALAYGLDN